MSTATLNSALYRKVKTHTTYDRYFTKTPCKSTYLGEYTTTGGMQQMVEWAFKYNDFSKEISEKLKRASLKETVASIYQFSYDHIQYQADGYDQQLRSPSCTWNARLEGIDCKSYSLFVSTILTNLNIPHSFRKVKQPASPSRWSHVYVVIHSGTNTFIIDPTKRVNTEVKYTQKEDMEVKLPYYGLHGSQEMLEEFVTDDEIFSGFKQVIALLKKAHVEERYIKRIINKTKVSYYKFKGFDFPFRLEETGLLIDDEILILGTNQQGLNAAVVGVGFLKNILGDVDFGQEIGKVFKYGLNSWGASHTPESYPGSESFKAYMAEIERLVKKITPENVGPGLSRVDQYLSFLNYQHRYWRDNIGRAYSSRLAMTHATFAFDKIRIGIVDKLVNEYQGKGVNFVITQTTTSEMMPWHASKTKFGRASYTHRSFRATNINYDKKIDPIDPVKTIEDIVTGSGTTPVKTSNPPVVITTTTDTTSDGGKKVNQAGIGGGTIAIAALVLGGGFLLLNNNKEKSNTIK